MPPGTGVAQALLNKERFEKLRSDREDTLLDDIGTLLDDFYRETIRSFGECYERNLKDWSGLQESLHLLAHYIYRLERMAYGWIAEHPVTTMNFSLLTDIKAIMALMQDMSLESARVYGFLAQHKMDPNYAPEFSPYDPLAIEKQAACKRENEELWEGVRGKNWVPVPRHWSEDNGLNNLMQKSLFRLMESEAGRELLGRVRRTYFSTGASVRDLPKGTATEALPLDEMLKMKFEPMTPLPESISMAELTKPKASRGELRTFKAFSWDNMGAPFVRVDPEAGYSDFTQRFEKGFMFLPSFLHMANILESVLASQGALMPEMCYENRIRKERDLPLRVTHEPKVYTPDDTEELLVLEPEIGGMATCYPASDYETSKPEKKEASRAPFFPQMRSVPKFHSGLDRRRVLAVGKLMEGQRAVALANMPQVGSASGTELSRPKTLRNDFEGEPTFAQGDFTFGKSYWSDYRHNYKMCDSAGKDFYLEFQQYASSVAVPEKEAMASNLLRVMGSRVLSPNTRALPLDSPEITYLCDVFSKMDPTSFTEFKTSFEKSKKSGNSSAILAERVPGKIIKRLPDEGASVIENPRFVEAMGELFLFDMMFGNDCRVMRGVSGHNLVLGEDQRVYATHHEINLEGLAKIVAPFVYGGMRVMWNWWEMHQKMQDPMRNERELRMFFEDIGTGLRTLLETVFGQYIQEGGGKVEFTKKLCGEGEYSYRKLGVENSRHFDKGMIEACLKIMDYEEMLDEASAFTVPGYGIEVGVMFRMFKVLIEVAKAHEGKLRERLLRDEEMSASDEGL
ncbi:hypothetical protein FUAX_12670 [Fulvitalea axinellae]|uniref:Uncharacterized protein n=2 Tax=Fulvitalea axinellae TaxID=1182444 RepID=A0AAU9D979_9BACT|nr:hypothetical protein FUAX_12670 [Fulvitalea axinellae]